MNKFKIKWSCTSADTTFDPLIDISARVNLFGLEVIMSNTVRTPLHHPTKYLENKWDDYVVDAIRNILSKIEELSKKIWNDEWICIDRPLELDGDKMYLGYNDRTGKYSFVFWDNRWRMFVTNLTNYYCGNDANITHFKPLVPPINKHKMTIEVLDKFKGV